MEKFSLMSCLLARSQTKLIADFVTDSVFVEDLCSEKVRESYNSENGSLLQFICKASSAVGLSDSFLQVAASTRKHVEMYLDTSKKYSGDQN